MENTLYFLRFFVLPGLVLPGIVRTLGVGSRGASKTSTDKDLKPESSTGVYHKFPWETASQLQRPEMLPVLFY